MEDFLRITLYSSLAGVTVFLGGLLANIFETHVRNGFIKEEILHTSIALGGGIIIAAVAFVLVPRGMEVLPLLPMAVTFLTGAVVFFFLDSYIAKKGGSVSQLLAINCWAECSRRANQQYPGKFCLCTGWGIGLNNR